MRRVMNLAAAMSLAVSMVACSDDGNRTTVDERAKQGAARTGEAVGTAGERAGNWAMGDTSFVKQQLKDGQKEIALGQLAAQRASHAAVKDFGQMMVRDHQQAGAELRQLAATAKVELDPEDAREDAKDAQERFAKLNGREFDREYIDLMVQDHEKAVDDVKDKAENSDNPQVKQWASKTLPKLQQHLEHARQLQRQVSDAASRSNRNKPNDRRDR